ncbi:uncharacterized protein LOC6583364 [Drosophila mojavensis]|uniref:CHK kinase-like domain-containing protein n=1 Tax=Drosophila mojavensis TaxID=7230 RepID=B4KVN9_DROMO|nr:uncharacterized protein LOC6583364 [Drosophila mojavensis]EDW19510.1 uncharacterized protein Dmoj_GI11487 [Drosophila mojavensis]
MTTTAMAACASNGVSDQAGTTAANQYVEDIECLRKLFRSKNLTKFSIGQISCSAGSSSGDNYMSLVKRVTIHDAAAAESATATASCSVIIKRQIASISRRQLYRCGEAFTNEINVYQHVVPLLCRYSQQPLFPQCHIASHTDGSPSGEPIIVLQDLKALGFRMMNRLAGLDLRHCLLVMKKLAQLHAASLAAQHLESAHFAEQCAHMSEIVYCPDAADFYSRILDTSVQQALDSLNASNADGYLSAPIRLIEQLQPKLFGQLHQSINAAAATPLSVICHGDLWLNNLMFRSQPEEVIFFDLQAMRRTSPVFDLLHFIYTSTHRQLRDVHTDTLLAAYAEALRKELGQQLRHTPAANQLAELCEIFSLQRLSEDYVRHVHYGLAISMWILPAVTFDPNNIPDLDVISELNLNGKEINCTQKLTPEYHLRIRDLALEFYEHGYLGV